VVDVLFFADIIMNFRTTFVNPKTNLEVFDERKIALTYVKSKRFWVDLLASIPFEIFVSLYTTQDDGQTAETTRTQIQILGLFKMVRLLRLGRIISFMKVQTSMKVGFKLIQLLFGIILLVHWLGCIWYLLVFDET
jgi:hypothetical protein